MMVTAATTSTRPLSSCGLCSQVSISRQTGWTVGHPLWPAPRAWVEGRVLCSQDMAIAKNGFIVRFHRAATARGARKILSEITLRLPHSVWVRRAWVTELIRRPGVSTLRSRGDRIPKWGKKKTFGPVYTGPVNVIQTGSHRSTSISVSEV
ncbi:hypothetical protein RRG08_004262 [Elysia crispata]|uniref:Uncharacterized protein n=1 Tax=Elysia crispata TaxID=231223 RepID=A0AAE0ZXF7_9GAST|nr:hypothetical protein RRG08_004262 [Elysia crispata]